MSHPATSQFLDGLKSSRLLDDARVNELRSRPEATWGDVASLSTYAQERGWLTPYQARELQEGRGDRLTIHGYQIFDKLDEGPHGTVYKALHPALQQPVSLQIINPDWLTPADTTSDYVARLRAASRSLSPHLATVLDAGTVSGTPFVVREYVDGCDLFRLVNEMGALPPGLACEYARQAALALKSAHNRGVVHGDVGPHTLLLTPVKRATRSNGDVSIRPRPGATIKLVELGLAPRRPPVNEMTYGQSDRLGAVGFLPPERLTSGEPTTAGDMYGLGATLYYLLTTRPPHAGNSPLAVLLDLQQAEPSPLDTLKSDVPPAVADLVRRLLCRDPAARPTASEAAEALVPYCEPSAMPQADDDPGGVLLAHETRTQPAVPTAVPVAPDLDHPDVEGVTGPFAEEVPPSNDQPLAEPLPEVQPLDRQYNGHELVPEIQPLDEHAEVNGNHHESFGHSALGADAPRAPRRRTKVSSKSKMWMFVGLGLWLFAIFLWIGFFTNWFASSSPTEPDPKTKTAPTKLKAKKS